MGKTGGWNFSMELHGDAWFGNVCTEWHVTLKPMMTWTFWVFFLVFAVMSFKMTSSDRFDEMKTIN